MEATNKVTLAVLQADVRHLTSEVKEAHESALDTQRLVRDALGRLTAMETRFEERWDAHWALHKDQSRKSALADVANAVVAVVAGIVGVSVSK